MLIANPEEVEVHPCQFELLLASVLTNEKCLAPVV